MCMFLPFKKARGRGGGGNARRKICIFVYIQQTALTRTTLASMATRSAKRKEEAERTFRDARERARRADAAFNGNPLRGRLPEGWEFDDGKEAAFVDRQLNSRVILPKSKVVCW